ncbi:MAG: hypothetical protein J6Z11_12715 [Candidatus Riflebacteria bacterium]|nr:hypothetical protein [Candidatus Riflebacteria bacterium]
MHKYFKTPSTIILSILLGLTCSNTYAQDPFAGDNSLEVIETSNSESLDAPSNITVTDFENTSINSDEYPIEGTINCQYGQYCRLGPWGDIVTILPPGTKVTVTGKEGDWYTTQYNGKKCYLHYSLVDTPTTPAYDGYHEYAYKDVNPNYTKKKPDSSSSSQSGNSSSQGNSGSTKTVKNPDSNNQTNPSTKIDTTKSINGPGVPDCLLSGLEAAKKSVWNKTNDKCLQFAGTIAEEAGAPVSSKGSGSQPQIAWANTRDISMRGQKISSLKEAALNGKLLPGMLIHVKAHYNEDPDYARSNDGHHWFMYMGLVNGEPMFVDNIRDNKLRNTETQAQIFNTSKYGDRYITTIYDPFASQR